jgi:hypothetical protein
MYEQIYSQEVVTAFELQQRERAIERRRSIDERADQVVPRPASGIVRMLERMLGRRATAREVMRARPDVADEPAVAPRATDAAPAGARAVTAPREPVAAR